MCVQLSKTENLEITTNKLNPYQFKRTFNGSLIYFG